ncbi:uncharacterized protein LOC123198965 [Mangifera indica]|uniref:uncharacterized protein LOC123198965 n=1 Tax=Mangifera indica TaxID=29780 RepID=UPI001CF9C28D|nr:uncharacterized protein LOC123198965 [Mangifera indica]
MLKKVRVILGYLEVNFEGNCIFFCFYYYLIEHLLQRPLRHSSFSLPRRQARREDEQSNSSIFPRNWKKKYPFWVSENGLLDYHNDCEDESCCSVFFTDCLNDAGVEEIVKEAQHSCEGFESLGRMTTCGVKRKRKMQRRYMSLLKFQAEIGEIFANYRSLDILISQQPETPASGLFFMIPCQTLRKFKKDVHMWSTKDGKPIQESHVNLKAHRRKTLKKSRCSKRRKWTWHVHVSSSKE